MTTERIQPLAPGTAPDSLPGSGIESWTLDESMTFLNHGSFGARPRAVSSFQRDLKSRLDADPADLLWVRGNELLEEALAVVARFVGADPTDIVAVTNATDAINAVVRSMNIKPGQSIVATVHGYNAVNQALRFVAERAGAILKIIEIHPPLPDDEGLVDAILQAVDDQTALVVVDHVSSPTAMLFPVERIVSECRRRGVRILVDGAHAPGMLPLDVKAVGADYYTGNMHKWVSAPLGAAFLYVSPELQGDVHPTIISHEFEDGFQREFAWTGTRDISPFLSVPSAITWFEEQFGWDAVREHNRQLVAWAAVQVTEAWSVSPLDVPESSGITSMRTIELPSHVRNHFDTPEQWRDWLRVAHGIDTAVHDWADRWWLRLSAHIYNRPCDYHRLIDVGQSFA